LSDLIQFRSRLSKGGVRGDFEAARKSPSIALYQRGIMPCRMHHGSFLISRITLLRIDDVRIERRSGHGKKEFAAYP
jgi:hypothetical protein